MGQRRQSRRLSIAPIRQGRDAARETPPLKLRENCGHNSGLGRWSPVVTSQIIATGGTGTPVHPENRRACALLLRRAKKTDLPVAIAPCNYTPQPNCSALFTSIIIADAVGSVNPPAK